MSEAVSSNRALSGVVGGTFVAIGVLALAWAGDAGAAVLGAAMLLAGVLEITRRREVRLTDEGIEVQSYFRRRRHDWSDVGRVAVERRWLTPFRPLVIELSSGRTVLVEGIGAFGRRRTQLDEFAERANSLAQGPEPPRPRPRTRRRTWAWALAFLVAFGCLALAMASSS